MKNKSLLIRTGIIVAITLLSAYLIIGPRRTPTSADFTWEGIKANLAENINLGLDLKGGSHLEMRVDTEDYLKKMTDGSTQAAYNAALEAKLPVSEPVSVSDAKAKKYEITIGFTDPTKKQDIIDAIKKKVDFVNWDESSTDASVTWNLPVQIQKLMARQAVDQAVKIIDSRINAFGVKEPTLQRLGAEDSARILLQMPGVDDPERIKKLLNTESRLELAKIVSPPSPSPVQTYGSEQEALQSMGGKLPPNRRVLKYLERDDGTTSADPQTKPPERWVVIESPAIVDGADLREANAVSRTGGDKDYQISFMLKPIGAQKFGDWTGKNINNYMAVVLNDEVKSAAYIKSQIFDSGEISGRFTKASADDLALTLKSGALPAKIVYQEERTVGPSLGADSIRAGLRASIGGLIFVMIFMLIYYRGSGVNAIIALALNMLLTLAALVWIDSTLTLPGIAGLILGIGMAVDSNVLIFERIREELRTGKKVAEAVELGFDRAFVTIIDTHITTILSSIILYMYGSGPIRGFAVTLILGLLINLFSAVFVSRTIFLWVLNRKPDMQKLSI